MTAPTQNADPADLAKFAPLAKSWWDPAGPSKPLHDLNPLRLRYIEQAVRLQEARILDVGCGGGILSEAMARSGARVLGIDLAQAVLDVAELHALGRRLAVGYRAVAAGGLAAAPPGSFYPGTCLGTLEHR